MPIPAAALIGAAAIQAGGSIMSAVQSNKSAEAINDRQMRWNENVARNAHQWEVEDLQKAGLNPVLSAGGSGASAPGISPVMPDTSGYAGAGNAVMSAVMNMYDAKVKDETAKNIAADTENKEQDTKNKKELEENIKSQTNLNKHQLNYLSAQIREIESNIKRNSVLNSKDKAEIGKISHEIIKIDTDVALNKVTGELKSAQKDLTKDLEALVIAKARQTTETYKGLILDNKIKAVKAKLRYVDAVLERCNTVLDMGVKTADMINKGTGSIKNISEAAGNIIPIKQGLEAISNASKVLDNY